MGLDSWLHLIHVLAAMVWVGGGVMLVMVALRARSSTSPTTQFDFARLLTFAGLRVLMPSVVLVLVTGVWMVFENSEWKFTQAWVLLALVLFAVAFAIGAIYLSRVGIQLERVTRGDAGAGSDVAARAAALTGRWLAGYGVVLAVLLVAVWDMVFKPGL